MKSLETSIVSVAKESQDNNFAEDYLPALLAQAHNLISSEFHKVVESKGFTVAEWRVLSSLADGETQSLGKLAQLTVIKQPTLTRMIDRMETRGFVRRVPHLTDRRITLVRIMADGNSAVVDLMELALEHEQRVLMPFGIESANGLKQTLKHLIKLHTPPASI